jgi:hypothetical protein
MEINTKPYLIDLSLGPGSHDGFATGVGHQLHGC